MGFSFRAFFIKRIVAVPGDEVYVDRGVVYVNGKPLAETHITDRITPWPDSFPGVCYEGGASPGSSPSKGISRWSFFPPTSGPSRRCSSPSQETLARSELGEVCEVGRIKLKPGYYFVMGDNRTLGGSEDSRTFGPIPVERIAGRASFVWWPVVVREEGALGSTSAPSPSPRLPPGVSSLQDDHHEPPGPVHPFDHYLADVGALGGAGVEAQGPGQGLEVLEGPEEGAVDPVRLHEDQVGRGRRWALRPSSLERATLPVSATAKRAQETPKGASSGGSSGRGA